MSAFTGIPQIGATQVTNAGTTSNDADAYAIDALTDVRDEVVGASNAFTITNADPTYYWESNITWRFTDDASPPTAQITVTVPASPARGQFAIINATGQDMQVEITSQPLSAPVIAAGDAAVLSNDGVNIELLSSGSGGGTFLSLSDTPSSYSGQGGKAVTVNSGGTALEFTAAAAGAGDALPFTLSPTSRGARVTKAADETTADYSTAIKVPWDTTVRDTDSFFSDANDRFVIPAGITKVRLKAALALTNLDATADCIAFFQKNGSNWDDSSLHRTNKTTNNTLGLHVESGIVDVVENDYFEAALQTVGDSTITVLASRSWFEIEVVETTDAVPSLRTVVQSLEKKTRGAYVVMSADSASADHTTETVPALDTVVYDTDSIFNGTTDRFVVPQGATKMRFWAGARFSGVTAGDWSRLRIKKAVDVSGATYKTVIGQVDSGDVVHDMNVSTGIIQVAAGDEFEITVQNQADTTTVIENELTFFACEIVEFATSTDAPVAYIAVPPEQTGALLRKTTNESIANSTPEDLLWEASDYDTKFDPGDGGPPQRFWLGADKTFVDGDVSVADDEITETAHGFETGEGPVFLTTTGTLPTGLSTGTKYWIIRVDANTLKFATSRANALAGTDVDITAAAGGGTHTIETARWLVVPANVAKIRLKSGAKFATATGGTRAIWFEKDDASLPAINRADGGASSAYYLQNDSATLEVSEGDMIKVKADQSSGGPINLEFGDPTYFSIEVVEESRAITYPGVTVTPPWRGARASLASAITGLDMETATPIDWDTEDEDTDGFWEGVTNPERMTIPTGLGIRRVNLEAFVQVTNLTAGADIIIIINKNGSIYRSTRRRGSEDSTTYREHITLLGEPVSDGDYFSVAIDITTGFADNSADYGTDSWFSLEVVETDENAFPPECITGFATGTLPTSNLLYHRVMERRMTVADALAGSRAFLITGPSTAITIDVDRNGTKIGAIDFAISATTGTFSTVASQQYVFEVGDRLSLDAPANWFSAADFTFSLFAWRS